MIKINSSDGGSRLSSLENGDIINFKMTFVVEGLFTDTDNVQNMGFFIQTGNIYDINANISCGSVRLAERGLDEVLVSLECSYVNNTGSTISNLRFGVLFNLYNNSEVVPRTFVNVFADTVTEYYKGVPKSNPYLPSVQNPSDTIGQDANDLKDAETELNDSTLQGREDTFNFFNTFSDVVLPFSMSMLAISQVFNYLVSNTIFESVLYVSITLGLVMLILNIIPSIFSRQDRLDKEKANKEKAKQRQEKNKSVRFRRKGGGS